MGGDSLRRKVILLEMFSFSGIVVFLWLDDLLDIPHTVFGASPSSLNVTECLVESLLTITVGAIVIYLTSVISGSSERKEEKVFQVCSACKKVSKDGRWIPLDDFISENSGGVLSHGICPDCMEAYYKGVTDTTALNYKQFLQYRKQS